MDGACRVWWVVCFVVVVFLFVCLLLFFADVHPPRIFWVRAMQCMCAQTRPRLYSHLKEVGFFRERSQNPCSLQGENLLYRKLRGGSNPRCRITQENKPNTLPAGLFRRTTITNFPCWHWYVTDWWVKRRKLAASSRHLLLTITHNSVWI